MRLRIFRLTSIFLVSAMYWRCGFPAHADESIGAFQDLAIAETTVTVALACGATEADAHAAARVIAQRFKQQQPALSEKVDETVIDGSIFDGVDNIVTVVKRDKGVAMQRPCSFWRSWTQMMIVKNGDFLTFGAGKGH